MARDLEADVRSANPQLLKPDEDVLGVFLGIPMTSKLALLGQPGLEVVRNARDHNAARSSEDGADGIASSVPKKTRFVMVTDERVAFFGGRAAVGGGAPTDVLMQTPMSTVKAVSFQRKGSRTTIDFADGSSIQMKTEPKKALKQFGQRYLGVDKPFKQ